MQFVIWYKRSEKAQAEEAKAALEKKYRKTPDLAVEMKPIPGPKKAREEAARQAVLDAGFPVTAKWLCNAVSEGNMDAVRLYFDAGFSADTVDGNDVPLICLAARKGSLDMCRFLVENGADVDKTCRDRGASAMVDAALGKFTDIISFLIEQGADANVRSKDGQSALIIAVTQPDIPAVEILLKAGANPDSPDNLGASARKYAALFHNERIIALFDTYTKRKKT
jgi:ankyrin repeat protein